jgi:CRISPR-associated protein Csm2
MQQRTSGRFNDGRQSHGGGGRPPPRQPPSIDVSRIVFGGQIDAKLYSEIAEAAAKAVAGGERNPRNKPSQLRRFYDELVALQDKARDAESFGQQLPFIQMLRAKVAYAKGRDKVDDQFVSLLNRVVDQARDAATLKQARLFMEAFMAYYKVYRPTEG